MSRLEFAVQQARVIRRRLLRNFAGWSLVGECGYASLLLAKELGGPASLRVGYNDIYECEGHAWNVVQGLVVDITASQFTNKRGVYVGAPLFCHTDMRSVYRGRAALLQLEEWWGARSKEATVVVEMLQHKRKA